MDDFPPGCVTRFGLGPDIEDRLGKKVRPSLKKPIADMTEHELRQRVAQLEMGVVVMHLQLCGSGPRHRRTPGPTQFLRNLCGHLLGGKEGGRLVLEEQGIAVRFPRY